MTEQWLHPQTKEEWERIQVEFDAIRRQHTLWLAVRQALLMVVDAIEVYLRLETRTSELRRQKR